MDEAVPASWCCAVDLVSSSRSRWPAASTAGNGHLRTRPIAMDDPCRVAPRLAIDHVQLSTVLKA